MPAPSIRNSSRGWPAPIVVIDEAHGAYTHSYTRILRWLGRGTRERDKPLIGLTATPFRGRRDSDETERLLRRFDDNLLDEGVFDSGWVADNPQRTYCRNAKYQNEA